MYFSNFAGLNDLVCTPMPSTDHAYTLPESVLDEAKLASYQQKRYIDLSIYVETVYLL